MNILAAKKPKVTYASLEMMRFLYHPDREIGTPIDRLDELLEEIDPGGKEADGLTKKYRPKGD